MNMDFKTEAGEFKLIKDALEDSAKKNDSLKATMLKVSNVFLNSSLISAQQAADEILSYPVCVFSNAHIFINTNRPEKGIVIRKAQNLLNQMDDLDNDFFMKITYLSIADAQLN
jgi:hypothetical protein